MKCFGKYLVLFLLCYFACGASAGYVGWSMPTTDVAGVPLLLHFDDPSASVASNSGNSTYGVSGGAYVNMEDADIIASGAGITANSFGSAPVFDGVNETVKVNNHWALYGDITTIGFAVECWFKADLLSGRLISKYGGTNGSVGNYDLSIQTDGKLRFFAVRSDGQLLNSYTGVVSQTVIQTGKWYHVAVQYNPGTKKWEMFINGVLDASFGTYSAWVIGSGAADVYIGSYAGTGHFFKGQIDEVKISRKYYDFSSILLSDMNNDGFVDTDDFLEFVSYWLDCTDPANSACQ